MHPARCCKLVVTSFFLLTAFAAASAQEPLLDFREKTLDNGLRIVTLEDFSCPVVAVHLWYHVGSKNEDPERTGFAHMFEHMMFRGTERLGPEDHFSFIRRTGGNCNAYTAFDQTVYIQTLPANQLELALWLEAERMSFLKIDQESFDTERKVVEEERRLGLNRPYGDVPETLLAEIFQKHPYRWLPIGNIAHLRAASVAELRDFWTQYYVPSNATLVVVGAVKHEQVQRLAERYFGWIPSYDEPPRVHVEEPLPTKARTIKLTPKNAPAPVVGVLYRTVPQNHRDYVALQMLGSILGGGQSSRLYRKLVAEEELAVFAVGGAMSIEQDGALAAGAVLPLFGGNAKKAIIAINDEIKRLRTDPVTPRELEKAKNQMLKRLVTSTMTVSSKAQLLGAAAVLENDASGVNRRLDRIRNVTQADLLRVAQKYLAPQRAIRVNIVRNLMGTLFGKKETEEDAPITAEPETEAPSPGRPGLTRPENFPAAPPTAEILDTRFTVNASERVLSNGMKVIVVPNHEVPYVSLRLGLPAGAWTESKPGTASMTMAMLTKGSEKHDEGELADELETYAISLAGGAEMDTCSVTAGCLSEHLTRALALMDEVVRTPTFPETEFEKLRKQTETALAITSAEPSYIADREFRRRLYGDHPYARTATGEIEDLRALTVADLKTWWGRFVRPEKAVLIVAGDVAPQKAFELAESVLGDWSAAEPVAIAELPKIPSPSATRIYLVDRPAVQSQIRVGCLGITQKHPEFFASRVVSGYFGGAFNARLNETIRVKKGLTYGASGGFYPQRFAGAFRISTFSKTATTAEAVKAIFDELDRLRAEPPDAEELNDTKSYLVGSFPSRRETPQQVAGGLWEIESNGLPADYFERMLTAVSATSAADCASLVEHAVNPAQMVVIVVGSATKLEDDLAKIAPVTIVREAAAERASAARADDEP